jgi:predicted RNase H-like nuclease (RuvC/YqgF family)
MLSSCKETVLKDEHNAQIANLIRSDERTRDSLEGLYIATLDEIDNNLDKIRDREGMIIMGPKSNSDLKGSKKEQIVNDISMINTLLEENKNKLAEMEKSLASYKKGKKAMVHSINQAKERMQLLEDEIEELKVVLAQNEFKINDLNKQLDERNSQLASLTEKNTTLDKSLNRVYFKEGTYKELKGSNIIKREGGVLGIGRVATLQQNLDKSKFKELSQKETTSIVLNGKKPKLITRHPVNSYTVSTTGDDLAQLTINDPESFWSYSKYLVVELK